MNSDSRSVDPGDCNGRGSRVSSLSAKLLTIYNRLLGSYKPQEWWPDGTGFEIVIGAILVQRATWSNAQLSLANLRAEGAVTPASLLSLDPGRLAALIRPSGCLSAKARALHSCAKTLLRLGISWEDPVIPPPALRAELLETFGVGSETADVITLYAAGQPTFVVDAYTRRLFARLALQPNGRGYEDWRTMFMSNLPSDAALFGDYHALIVRHGQEHCRPTPRCPGCVLQDICPSDTQREPTRLLATVGGTGA
jgi:endonuclease-3 related protein